MSQTVVPTVQEAQMAREVPPAPLREVVVVVPGDPVPWAAKVRSQKTGNRFLPARQEHAISRVLGALERLGEESFPAGVPLELALQFYVKRPGGQFGTGKNFTVVKPSAPMWPCGRPDLSNLVKLIEDSLVLGGLIPDDDQVTAIAAVKFYTQTREEQPRTVARIIGPTRYSPAIQ